MLDEFLKTLKGGLGEQLTKTAGLDSGKLDSVTDVVTDTFKDGLMEKFSGGDLSAITGLLGKGGSSSPLAGSLVSSVIGNLISKVGLSKDMSNTVAKFAVPFIIDKLSGFASDNGKDNEEGISDLMGDLLTGSVKDKLLGGLGKKFGF
jgi:hypothetical protein